MSLFHAKPLVVTPCVHKSFILVISFQKIEYFYLFSIVKMNANYAEICRVGNLAADFQQVMLVHIVFIKCSQYCCETNSAKKS